MGTWCLCLSQCCHPNCFGNSYLLLMLVAGRAPLNCRHITHSGCPSCWLLSVLHCHKTHHEWVSEWLIWNKIIAQGSCHSVWAVEKGCSPGAVRLYALGSLSPLSSCPFQLSLLRSTNPKPRQFRTGLWICHIYVWVWNLPLLLWMYSLAAPVRIRPTRVQSQAGLFIFPCPALPTQHFMAGIQVPPCSPNSTALPTETRISHSSEQPPKSPEEQMSPTGACEQHSVGSTHSHPSDKGCSSLQKHCTSWARAPGARRPHKPQNKGPARFRNSIFHVRAQGCMGLSGCNKISPWHLQEKV